MTIATLEVTLEEMAPAVGRRLAVPFDIRLDRLHLTLQAAFGWTDSHLWEITADGVGWGIPDPDWPSDMLDARKTTLFDVVEDTGIGSLDYLYDFGDGWEHRIKIKDIAERDPQLLYPILLDGTGRCPPEDVGGPWGYGEFLEAINDPTHEQHDHWAEWGPPGFDPNDAGIDHLKANVEKLAKRWKPRPKKK